MAIHERRQSGTVTLAVGVDAEVITVEAYDPAKTIAKVSATRGLDWPSRANVTVQKTSPTTITVRRAFANGLEVIDAAWELHEFSLGVTVQDISQGLAFPGTIAINAVDLTKSFIIDTAQGEGDDYSERDAVRVRFNSSTEIETLTDGAFIPPREIQVVEYDGCTVQELTHSLAATTLTSTTVTIPTAVDPAKTLILGTYTSDGGEAMTHAEAYWRATLPDSTTITLDRFTGTSFNLAWNLFVIEFTDGTVVQSGQATVSGASLDIALSDTDLTRSGAFLANTNNQLHTGRTNVADDDHREGHLLLSFPDDTTLRLTRENSTGDTEVFYQVVTFNRLPLGIHYRNKPVAV